MASETALARINILNIVQKLLDHCIISYPTYRSTKSLIHQKGHKDRITKHKKSYSLQKNSSVMQFIERPIIVMLINFVRVSISPDSPLFNIIKECRPITAVLTAKRVFS